MLEALEWGEYMCQTLKEASGLDLGTVYPGMRTSLRETFNKNVSQSS